MSESAHLSTFRNNFKGDLVFPSDPEYNSAIQRYFINAIRKAKLVCYPKDAADIKAAIKFSRDEKMLLAVRGGGHSATGASSAEGGLVIDLSRYLNSVRIDADKKLAYVGGGATWEPVEETAIKHGLATTAGNINDTGVGGLILGGGYGFLAPKHGLAVDNLVQATVVTAAGETLTANSSTNEDLYWAIRGGGGNFGVCTEFVLRLHDQRRTVYAGTLIYTADKVEQVCEAIDKWWKGGKGPSDDEVILNFFARGPDGNPVCVVSAFYNGSEEDGRKVFKSIIDIGPVMDTTTEIPFEKLNTLAKPFVGAGHFGFQKSIFAGPLSKEVSRQVFDQIAGITEPYKSDLHCFFGSEFYRIPEKGEGSFVRHDHGTVLYMAFAKWDNDYDKIVDHLRKGTTQVMDLISTKKGVNEQDQEGYTNYSSEAATTDRSALTFGKNYPRLQQLKKKYDPEGLFSRWFPITPA